MVPTCLQLQLNFSKTITECEQEARFTDCIMMSIMEKSLHFVQKFMWLLRKSGKGTVTHLVNQIGGQTLSIHQ